MPRYFSPMQLLARELRARLVPLASGDLVQVLREGLRQAVGEGLDHDRAVVVVLGLEARRRARRRRGPPSRRRRRGGRRWAAMKSASEKYGLLVAVVDLLPQHRKADAILQHDVVALRMRRPEAVDAFAPGAGRRPGSRPAAPFAFSKSSRAAAPCEGLSRIAGKLSLELPRVEEEGPVDVAARASPGRARRPSCR